jgi:Na+/melibiose symporter-like transporter
MASSVPPRLALSLAVVQFFFALSWTVYVVFLPTLAAQVGIPASAVVLVLMLDQLVFVLSDYALGIAADRASRLLGRIGPMMLGVTVVSCLAFLLLPVLAPNAPAWAFIGLVVLWSVTSSALRAPPLTLIGRHAARPSRPALLACTLLGLGVANAISPYLGLQLRALDPRLPFLVCSVAVALATLGLVAAERALARSPAAPVEKTDAATAMRVPAWRFVVVALVAACAFQSHVFLASGPLYQRFAAPAAMPQLAPVFWIGFNLALWPASLAGKRFGALPMMAAAGVLAAVGSALAHLAPDLASLVVLQLLVGAAWGALLMGAFSFALDLGQPAREGRFSGLLSSVLALAALARLSVVNAEWQKTEAIRSWLAVGPAFGWLLAGLLVFAAWRMQAARASRPA